MNSETMIQRLQTQLNKLNDTKCSQQIDSSITFTSKAVPSFGLLHGWSSGCVMEPAFQKVTLPNINAIDYLMLPKEALSHPSIVHEPVFSPDNSSITTCTDMDVLSNFCVSDGGSNLEASSNSFSSYFPKQHAYDSLEMDLRKYRDASGVIQRDDSVAFHTTMGKPLQSESSKLLIPQYVTREILQGSNPFPGLSSSSSLGDIKQYQTQKLDFQQKFLPSIEPDEPCSKASIGQSSACFVDRGEHCYQMLGQTTLMQPQFHTRLLDEDEQFSSEFSAGHFGLDGCANVNSCSSSKVSDEHFKNSNNFAGYNGISFMKYMHSTVCSDVSCACEMFSELLMPFNNCQNDIPEDHLEFPNSTGMDSVVRDNDTPSSNSVGMPPPAKRTKLESSFGVSLMNNTSSDQWIQKMAQPYSFEALPVLHQQPESPLSSFYSDVTECNGEQSMGTLSNEPLASDIEDIQSKTGLNQDGISAKKDDIQRQADQEKETKLSSTTVNIVSLTEFFTSNQIKEHIVSLRKQFVPSTTKEEMGVGANTCQLCAKEKLFYAPVPIYCIRCGIRIRRNANYFNRTAEEFATQHYFCTVCYRNSRGENITFNGISLPKKLLDRKKNDEVFEEAWVQCNQCNGWQHQICALYNDKRDLDCSAEYTCPICCLMEIENGLRVPSPKTAMFGAKDLPSTILSDHIEKRLFNRLMQESTDRAKVDENENLHEVLAKVAESLSVRVVLSVDKQLKVKQQFLDIFSEENYTDEFSYRSKVILLFQKIEGVDVCLFAMYVQEFGSECGYPNQRCVYISYLDSVKYFRPERETMSGEALRTFVYHEILIGYLDFCKKRGFTTCYLWACPPLKGEDYIIYSHPDTQKTPKNDKLRHWYHSMLKKAAAENIVVGFSNIYDHFFVPTGKFGSSVTAARLPYFDGDYWSGAAMDIARKIEQENGGDYIKVLNSLVSKRSLKAMGHENPSKGTAKDILVMQKLGQMILPVKENFIIVHLQYACTHCHEVIMSGMRWFCNECKEFQECERCHTADSHTSISGKKHTLHQVLVDDVLSDTKETDIIIDNGLFGNRHNFLSFCQKNQYQFDTLRRAKYSTMMILYHLKNPALLTVGTICSICSINNVFQQSWKCEICPGFTICSACYKERGADCHEHKLSQTYSTALCPSGNQELKQKSLLVLELVKVLQHASQCFSTKTQPCSYPNCLLVKKLFYHVSKCTLRVSGGCQCCKKAWLGLTVHSRNCRDVECRVPRCRDLKMHAEQVAFQFESRLRAAVTESIRALSDV